jgi:hypothetical protein
MSHLAKVWHFIITIKGVTLNTSMGRYHFRPFQKYHGVVATFFSETTIPWILWIRISNAEQLKQKDDAEGNNIYSIIIHCFYARLFITRRDEWYLWENDACRNNKYGFLFILPGSKWQQYYQLLHIYTNKLIVLLLLCNRYLYSNIVYHMHWEMRPSPYTMQHPRRLQT